MQTNFVEDLKEIQIRRMGIDEIVSHIYAKFNFRRKLNTETVRRSKAYHLSIYTPELGF